VIIQPVIIWLVQQFVASDCSSQHLQHIFSIIGSSLQALWKVNGYFLIYYLTECYYYSQVECIDLSGEVQKFTSKHLSRVTVINDTKLPKLKSFLKHQFFSFLDFSFLDF
jgi:hypothetical protein